MKWKRSADLPIKRRTEDQDFSTKRCICYDECNKIVYVVGNKGDVSKYDINKDEWIVFNVKWPETCYSLKCWMKDGNTLCCSNGEFFRFINVNCNQENGDKYWERIEDLENMIRTSKISNDSSPFSLLCVERCQILCKLSLN